MEYVAARGRKLKYHGDNINDELEFTNNINDNYHSIIKPMFEGYERLAGPSSF